MEAIGRILLGGFQRIAALALALAFTLGLFLVLPLIQSLAKSPTDMVQLSEWDPNNAPPPPPPPPEPEPEPEPEEEPPPPPEFDEAPPPMLDLAAMSSALDIGAGLGGYGSIAMGARLDALSGGDADDPFGLGALDQEPRATHQPGPSLTAKLRKRGPGQVRLIFIVDERGRVESPTVVSSSDPIFDRPAIDAVKKWKFEPGMRGGAPAQGRQSVTISFPGEK
ncbi:transport protein TonB [Planctomycetes bacterium Pla163]|uniref:Transport protein TonB n=1 Tax=Rohdeia mirabilis TaxID=2528008 RepID=A0A518CXH2_9BACT|nr:transport protein TonB [Planctomycetes bacterium Pla163]